MIDMKPMLLTLAQAPNSLPAIDYSMTPLGWGFMICSLAMVLLLLTFCFWRVLSHPAAANHMHAPLDIDTHDQS